MRAAFGLLASQGLGLMISADETDEIEHGALAVYSCDMYIYSDSS